MPRLPGARSFAKDATAVRFAAQSAFAGWPLLGKRSVNRNSYQGVRSQPAAASRWRCPRLHAPFELGQAVEVLAHGRRQAQGEWSFLPLRLPHSAV
jgi:hypothetical protein